MNGLILGLLFQLEKIEKEIDNQQSKMIFGKF